MTREVWLRLMTVKLRADFSRRGIELPSEIAVSCGWPSKNARARNGRRIGECWRADCSAGRRPEIFISPTLADSVEVAAVLVHEMIHAALPDAGHGPAFKRAAVQLGLTGKMTATVAGPDLRDHLALLVRQIDRRGYPHAELRPLGDERKQSTRLIKLECRGCGYVIRTTRKWIEVGTPVCCCGEPFEEG